LAGLVFGNRPWRLVPHLAGATAAAAATAAYGVVTTTFWNMADALAPWRLALINAVAIAIMILWLLLYNRLWERPSHPGERKKALLYNVSTVLTLAIAVVCMYAILYVVALVAALAIIDGSYLSSRLGHPGGFASFATIAWLASSIGVVAGALGSSFETEEAVRKATYGKRERERQRARQELESGPSSASKQKGGPSDGSDFAREARR
jgi:signal transduction histidine kinase